jgi:3'-phosphoadenosine 5'-phosphosulfate sulfotransferase (PAPS reductase)/FAD synthetase
MQLELFQERDRSNRRPIEEEAIDVQGYDQYLVAFSGGKDSVAALLTLLEAGVPRDRIELHHHLVDGREGSDLFDWPVTEDYCRQFARALGIPIYFSWLEGGLEREMLRSNQPKAATCFEVPGGAIAKVGGRSAKLGTRRKFPAKVANLQTRWCSAYAKIDVFSALVNNQNRFHHQKILVVTGERAEESASRAKYQVFEPHRNDARGGKLQRHIDHWRPVHHLSEKEVWAKLEAWKIQPHPAYRIGFGRLSCARCIFGSPSQWATNRAIAPVQTERMAEYEREFEHTVDAKWSIGQMVGRGAVYRSAVENPQLVALANGREYVSEIVVDRWEMPAGAFGEQNGSI